MAIGTNVFTYADLLLRTDTKGMVPPIAEVMNQDNTVAAHVPWKECNNGTSNIGVMRTGLPTVYWRIINQAVQVSKSTTAKVEETCGFMEAWSEFDYKLLDIARDKNGVIMSESKPFIEAMEEEFISKLFYGNQAVDTESFTGMSPRYSSLSANNARNIISGGGSGSDNESIWLIGWGENSCHGIVPQGMPTGLTQDTKGKVTIMGTSDIGGTRMDVHQTKFEWNCGLALPDWRKSGRVCNLDVSDIIAAGESAPNILNLMWQLYATIKNPSSVNLKWYMRQDMFKFVNAQRLSQVSAGGGITMEIVDGVLKPTFLGREIVIVDGLLDTEDVVS